MKRKPHALYQTADELDERIDEHVAKAHKYPQVPKSAKRSSEKSRGSVYTLKQSAGLNHPE